MTLISPFKTHAILEILRNEVDGIPSALWCIVTLNGHYYVGTSEVCGDCTEQGFELRCRNGPAFSLRARGRFLAVDGGTEIAIQFLKPTVPGIFFGMLLNRFEYDKEKIVTFLQFHLKARTKAD